MAGGSSRRANRRRRHAKYGKPVYRSTPQTRGMQPSVVIVDEAAELVSAEPGTFDNTWSDDPPAVLRFQPHG